jgi:prepilin-type N-terminal cleavage/methylation domain-containing protein
VKNPTGGFTLIEVMVAIVVLTIGIMALVASSGSVTRMIGRGKVETRAAHAATRRMEILRLAAGVPPRCTDPGFRSGGPVISGGMSESWRVLDAGKVRHVRVTVTYLTVRGARSAMLETRLTC